MSGVNSVYDPELLAFVDGGMEIRNPFLSDCGRFEVDPRITYGFVEGQGGAWVMPGEQGRSLILTDLAGLSSPSLQDTDNAKISCVDKDGNVLASFRVGEIPFEE